MKSFVVSLLIASIAMNSESTMATRITQHNSQRGIFGKLIAEQEEDQKFVKDIEDAKMRKKQQLAEAEVEHEKLVAEEEKEDAANKEKMDALREEKAEEDKKDAARKHHDQLLKELTDDSNTQIKVQGFRMQ